LAQGVAILKLGIPPCLAAFVSRLLPILQA